MANPSTVWASLAVPNPAQGGVPFVYTDNATMIIDVLNLFWNQTGLGLTVRGAGDNAGTDTINIYRQMDSYLPTSAQSLVAASTLAIASILNGYSVSSSGGSALAPISNVTGDLLGMVGSAWSYQSTPVAYVPMVAEMAYAKGAAPNNLGGELHWLTKIDGGALTDRYMIDNTGALKPSTVTLIAGTSMVVSAKLGAASNGWGSLSLAYVISAVTGNVTQNTPCGIVQIAAGAKAVTVTNSLVTANSVVLATLQTVDATLLYVGNVLPAAGSFTITCNANATGTVKIAYLVIGTDS